MQFCSFFAGEFGLWKWTFANQLISKVKCKNVAVACRLAAGATITAWENRFELFSKTPRRFDVNKFQLYRQIREELVAHYEKELRNVSAVLQEGVDCISSANNRLSCGGSELLVVNGEANKAFREETAEAMRLILERYQRSLRKEIEALGLAVENDTWRDAGAQLSGGGNPSAGLRNGNGAEPH